MTHSVPVHRQDREKEKENMSDTVPVIEAQVELECQTMLGEGEFVTGASLELRLVGWWSVVVVVTVMRGRKLLTPVGLLWDSTTELLYWVDIDKSEVHA
jgi:hypothetical protein